MKNLNFLPLTSYFLPPTSYLLLLPPVSDFLNFSDFRLPTSEHIPYLCGPFIRLGGAGMVTRLRKLEPDPLLPDHISKSEIPLLRDKKEN